MLAQYQVWLACNVLFYRLLRFIDVFVTNADVLHMITKLVSYIYVCALHVVKMI